MIVNIKEYKEQLECFYKGEKYSVRDNGAVFRHSRINKPLRKLDNLWIFGKPNTNGYLLIASEVVHRIVAYAFLGEPPTSQHIVDHKDTNRQNNRPENLRWLTKLENILNNLITVKKITFLCGSIEAFLSDPSILKNHESEDRNFGWMRAVSPDEAKASWQRLSSWAESENSSSNGGSLGEWIYTPTKTTKKTENERIADEHLYEDIMDERIEKVLKEVERDTGISREEFSRKSKKREFLSARAYAANKLRSEIDLSEEGIGEIIGISKSMVNSYLNYPNSYIKDADYYNKNK